MTNRKRLVVLIEEAKHLAKELFGDSPLHCKSCGATKKSYPCEMCAIYPEDVKNWEYRLQRMIVKNNLTKYLEKYV